MRKEHISKVENVIKIGAKEIDGRLSGEEKRLLALTSSLVEAWLGHL